ncbi:putative geminivirus AL1 replication-associated protein, CLV type [Helianthus annuus]|nr:putative geminivirus AL1 replication-associated protein, CLV type [Helianthus annuus]
MLTLLGMFNKEYEHQKDGDVIDRGMFQKHGTSNRNQNFDPNTTYERALACNTKDEALQVIRDEQPRDFLLQHHNINYNLDRVYEIPTAPWVSPFPLSSFTNVPEDLQEWADSYFGLQAAARPMRPKSTIIKGSSRTSKTMWARSLGRHNYICGHMDHNKKVFSNNADYNIIDDIPPQYFMHWKEFIGAKRNWQSYCKYGKPSLVKGGIPTIMLCNPGVGFHIGIT